MGARCEDCGKDMARAKGCTITEMEADDGTVYQRIPYGHEADGYGFPLPERCHDCYARKGHYHHPGCDMAICGHCGGQELGCDLAPENRVEDALATALADQHHQVEVRVGEYWAWIDEDLVPLIRCCWLLAIDTDWSCQNDRGQCYVTFSSGEDAACFVAAVADEVEDRDLRARLLRRAPDAPGYESYQKMAEEDDWQSCGAGWEEWWTRAWEYESMLHVTRTIYGEAIRFPVTVRWPCADLPAVISALQAACANVT